MYKLTIYPAIEKNCNYRIEQQFNLKSEMDSAKDLAANLLLALQDNLKVMQDYSNIFLEEKWCEDEECWSELV